MSTPAIIVTKSGGTFFTRTRAARNSSAGEQGETEGTLRHLLERKDVRIVYFGQYEGEVLPGLTVVRPNIDGLNENSSAEDQYALWEQDVADLTPHGPFIGYINVMGYSPTFSWIDNPKFAQIQANGVRYTGPMLNALQRFDLPRIVVNNDPRTYPKDQEMSFGWDFTRPVALLDQCKGDSNIVVGGKQYVKRSVWARAESWAYHIRGENTDEIPCTIIAHAHIGDGCGKGTHGRLRDEAWSIILGDGVPDGCKVYGRGWESYSGYDPEVMPGPVKPNEVMDILRRSTCCPCVSAGRGFYTGKVYVCEAQGCIPLLFGRGGEPLTWDPYEKFLPFSSAWRIYCKHDLKAQVKLLRESEQLRADLRGQWHELCKPDYTMLDRVVNDLLAGRDWTTEDWFMDYGGYWPL